MRQILLLFAVLAFGLSVVSGCGEAEPTELTGMTRIPPLSVAGAGLPQTNPDRPTGVQPLAGQDDGLLLLYFGYTFCPDVCPTTLADLRRAISLLDEGQQTRVQPAMVTVDPRRDKPKVMNRYLGHFFPDGDFASFVPADRRQLARAERTFGVEHSYGKPDENGNYEVEHSAQIFAIDSAGEVLVEWPFGSSAENIASDIRLLLKRIDEGKS